MRAPQCSEKTADAPAAPKRLKSYKRNPEFDAAFGARIRAWRIAAKMSQSALGGAVGISFQQVQKYELGKDRVAVSTLQAIAAALGVHPGSFFDDSAPPTGSVSAVKAVVKLGQRIQRVRDPAIVRRLLALADLLADIDDEPSVDVEGTP